MNPSEPDLKAIFSAALEHPPGPERAAYIDGACGDDAALRSQLEALLQAHEHAGAFLETAAQQADAAPTVSYHPTSIAEGPGTLIGPYKLLQKIGEGGMGSVFMAEQEHPVRRKVALKVIKPGMDTRQVIARFEAERQALALMDHPHIARVLDAGATDTGRPFFVMDLVRGVPITQYCDSNRLTPKERLELFIPVCQAIQHAHQKGIIHRDIKPSNVLVTLHDGKPVPKVIDFGVAKAIDQRLTEQTLFTEFGAVIGTLEYMSPEQAELGALDIDTRSDIYSLGVVLYELLTGSTPLERARLRKAAYSEVLKRIREEEPARPSTRLSESRDALPSISAQRKMEPARLTKLVRGDLDWIAMKSLEKDRTRRYETANGLARDIQRYLDGDPVEACPPSATYRLKKFARKHRAVLATAAAFAFVLVVATAVSAGLAVWANAERVHALKAEATARDQQTRAQDREEMAIKAVRRFGDVVANEPDLKNNLALEKLRANLLREPQEFFRALRDRLQADPDTRPDSLDRLARASHDLGMITNTLGNKEDALIAFQEERMILQRLADANPTVTHFQSELGKSHNNIGNLLRATGKPAEALRAYENVLEIKQKLAEANPTVTELDSDLALSHNNIGILLRETGKPAEALKAHEKALTLQQKLVDANPTVAEYQCDLAASHSNIGILLSGTGKPAEALQAWEKALAIQEKLADANPTVTEFQKYLASTHNSLGNLLSATGKPDEALKAYEKALAIWQTLVAANPTVTEFQSVQATTHHNIGILLSDTGMPVEALKAHEKALAIQEKLADANPTVTEFQSALASSHNSLGNLLREAGKPAEALKAYENAVAIWQRLAEANPALTEFQSALAGGHNNVGILLSSTGMPAEALRAWEQALAIRQRLADANPTVTEFHSDLATSHYNIGILLGVTGKPAEALKSFEKTLAIQETLARSHPETPEFASRMGGTLNNLAILDLGANRFEEARDRLRLAIDWQRKALASYPNHPTYQQILAKHLDNLIKAAQALGDSEGVAQAERELTALRDSDPAMLALNARLAAVITGGQQPRDNAERLLLAQRAYDKALHAMAARLWDEALQADPALADDRQAQHRYNAACAAALAAAGQGKDDPSPDFTARARLRNQAIAWLQAELATWTNIRDEGPDDLRPVIAPTLMHWKVDTDLASLRDKAELAKLPTDESAALVQLWNGVEQLLARTSGEGEHGPHAEKPMP
jgi:serine/threonine protein kinase